MEFVKRLRHDQKGVVEATLVVIPLVALFLITVELIVAVNYRNLDLTYAQSAATSEAISTLVPDSDDVISFPSPNSFDELRLVISQRGRSLPHIVPFLPLFSGVGTPSTETSGIAVMERRP